MPKRMSPTATTNPVLPPPPPREHALRVLEHANAHPEILGTAETALLSAWLHRLAIDQPGSGRDAS